MRRIIVSTFCILSLSLGAIAAAQEQGPAPVSFSKDVAPIFLKNCQACHGQNDPKGDFQLFNYAALMKAEGAVTPGKPDDSELLRLLLSEEKEERMPKEADPLPADKVALVKRWIAEGAKFDGSDPAAALASIVPKEPHPAAPAAYPAPLPLTALAFRPDGQELAIGGYNEITIWNPLTGALLRRIGEVDQRTYGLAYNNDGTLLAAASGTPGVSGEVALFDPNQGKLVKVLGGMSDVAFDVAFNPAGNKLAACAADRSIRIWDVASGVQERIIEDHADWVMDIAWSPDGAKLASASRDKTSKVFDVAKGESLATFPGHGDAVYGVSFNADGTQVLTGGANRKIHVWKPDDGNKIGEIGGFGGEVYKVLVAKDMVYSCSADKTARQHKTADRGQVRAFNGHTDWVFNLAYNEATQRLATCSFDGEVRVWNLADGAQLAAFKASPGYPSAPAATAAK